MPVMRARLGIVDLVLGRALYRGSGPVAAPAWRRGRIAFKGTSTLPCLVARGSILRALGVAGLRLEARGALRTGGGNELRGPSPTPCRVASQLRMERVEENGTAS